MTYKKPDPKCELCDGTGEVAYDELDHDSMQYMKGVDVRPCPCTKARPEDEEYDDQL